MEKTPTTSSRAGRLLAVVALLASTIAFAFNAPPAAAQSATCEGHVATIVGTNGPDELIGTNGPDVIAGLGGRDVIRGLGGDDIICGHGGRDKIFGGPGADLIYGGTAKDKLKGNSGRDVIFGGPGSDRMSGGSGMDHLDGEGGAKNRYWGGRANDTCVYTSAAVAKSCDERITPSANCAGSTRQAFDMRIANHMFGLASQAYEVEPPARGDWGRRMDQVGDGVVRNSTELRCWELVATIESDDLLENVFTNTEVIVARNPQTQDLAVAYRGTEFSDPRDVYNDLLALRAVWRLPDGRRIEDAVHGGFDLAYDVVAREVKDVLHTYARPNMPGARVYFTGHSLGGALGTLASLDLVDDMIDEGYSRNEVVLYTFGAPRSMSQELAGHHRRLVPNAHAVVNPRDLVPHLPSAIGTDNPYSHIANMTVLHGVDDDSRIRIEHGFGGNYRGCARMPVGSVTDHFRPEYDRRLSTSGRVGGPSVSLTIASGNFRMNWDTPIEGPCDWVALYRSSSRPTNPQANLRGFAGTDGRRMVWSDGNDTHPTIHGKGDNYWMGYVNMFGEFVATTSYTPSTPTVGLRRNVNFGPDTIDFTWSVSDPGDRDLIVLFDRNPITAGPDGYYRSIVGRVEARATTNSPERTAIWVGSDPDDWWVAYIMRDDDGNQRILATSQGVQG